MHCQEETSWPGPRMAQGRVEPTSFPYLNVLTLRGTAYKVQAGVLLLNCLHLTLILVNFFYAFCLGKIAQHSVLRLFSLTVNPLILCVKVEIK